MAPDRRLPCLRRIAVALAAVFACFAGLGAGMAAAAPLPPEGIFEDCNLDTEMATCLQRLQVMHQGGLQVVVTPAFSASLDSLSTYAATVSEAFGHLAGLSLAGSDSEMWRSGSGSHVEWALIRTVGQALAGLERGSPDDGWHRPLPSARVCFYAGRNNSVRAYRPRSWLNGALRRRLRRLPRRNVKK